jgi:hypothetical protein
MNDEQLRDDRVVERWLDRLADGELDETSRRSLMEWLDEDPIRWRRCALILLESKEFERTMEDWAAAATPPAVHVVQQINHPPRLQNMSSDNGFHRHGGALHLRSFSAVVIVAIATFASGMFVERCWIAGSHLPDSSPRSHSQSTESSIQTANNDRVPANTQQITPNATHRREVVSDSVSVAGNTVSQATVPARSAILPDYVRGQLERQGYRVNSHQKLVSVVLPDGEKMTIPVEEWKFQYAGNRVY